MRKRALSMQVGEKRGYTSQQRDPVRRLRRTRVSIWSMGAGIVTTAILLGDAARAQIVLPNPLYNGPPGQSELNIVAHQDDDILFMNPAILDAVLKGTGQVVVFLTGGNFRPDDLWYGQMRENGAMHGYSKLLQLAGHINQGDFKSAKPNEITCAPFTDKVTENPGTIGWNRTQLMVGSHRIEVAMTRDAQPPIVLFFLRLNESRTEDGTPVQYNLQNEDVGELANLSHLFRGIGPATIKSFDSRNEYTKEQLIEVLRNIIRLVKPTIVRTQDSENPYPVDGDNGGPYLIDGHIYDHSDHYWGARFAKEALRMEGIESYFIYKGYDVQWRNKLSTRVVSSDLCYKRSIMYFYGLNDPKVVSNNDPNGVNKTFVDFNYDFIGYQEGEPFSVK